MSLLTFHDNPLAVNLGLFAVGAGAIWWAGTKLERYADAIARRTGLGQAFVGLVLLAAATSLPELATSVTAVLIGNPSLAVHNLLGGVVLQTGLLAVADVVSGPKALTHRSPSFVLLIEGRGVVFLLSLVLMGAGVGRAVGTEAVGPGWVAGLGAWELILVFAYLLVLYQTYRGRSQPRWAPQRSDDDGPDDPPAEGQGGGEGPYEGWSLAKLSLAFAGGSLVVLVAGWAVASTGDALAGQTGLGAGFVGATLVALATSLPEVSTTVSASRNGNHEMAFSNIFGSNAFDITLLSLVGLLASGQAAVQSAAPSAVFAAGLGVLVTCVYLWGLLDRRDRTVLWMGWDSAAVVVLAVAGNAVIYHSQAIFAAAGPAGCSADCRGASAPTASSAASDIT